MLGARQILAAGGYAVTLSPFMGLDREPKGFKQQNREAAMRGAALD